MSRKTYSAKSLPMIVSLRGRCLLLITCRLGANSWMVTRGSPTRYVPGTASSRFCKHHIDLRRQGQWLNKAGAQAGAMLLTFHNKNDVMVTAICQCCTETTDTVSATVTELNAMLFADEIKAKRKHMQTKTRTHANVQLC